MLENNLTSSVTNTIENIECFQYSHTLQRSYLILRSQKPLLGQDQARGPPGGGGGSSCFSLPSSAASPLSASHPARQAVWLMSGNFYRYFKNFSDCLYSLKSCWQSRRSPFHLQGTAGAGESYKALLYISATLVCEVC